jgi:hypothetical protein
MCCQLVEVDYELATMNVGVRTRMLTGAYSFLALVLTLSLCLDNALSRRPPHLGSVPHTRSYFYVGQEYLHRESTTIAMGQMYVERLRPSAVTQAYPVLIIPGNGTSAIWTQCFWHLTNTSF